MGKIYWHLPGFYVYFYLNQIIIHLMKAYPDCFHEDYAVGSVYGTFPGAIWNGGRSVIGCSPKSEMQQIIRTYNQFDVPVRFTWTNPLIGEDHVKDTYCNLIMRLANNGKNQVLVNSTVLEDYLRKTYPDFGYISSTTKRLTTLEEIRKELENKGYELVVLDYDLNHDEAALDALKEEASRIEILVDEICFPGCPKRKEHYLEEGRMQLEFDRGTPFPCPNRSKAPDFEECKKRPAFIAREQIPDYVAKGFVNFKLVGRGLPMEMVKESYLYYLVKEEKRDFIKAQLEKDLKSLTGGRK